MTTSTRLQSLTKLQAALARGTEVLGRQEYSNYNHTQMCAIGVMLTPEVLTSIREYGLSGASVERVASHLSRALLVNTTGLKMLELSTLQSLHDMWSFKMEFGHPAEEIENAKMEFFAYVAKLANQG